MQVYIADLRHLETCFFLQVSVKVLLHSSADIAILSFTRRHLLSLSPTITPQRLPLLARRRLEDDG